MLDAQCSAWEMSAETVATEASMLPEHDKHTDKKVSIRVNTGLVRLAKESKINFSALLVESLRREELQRWRKESSESFKSYNRMVKEHGLLSDDLGLL